MERHLTPDGLFHIPRDDLYEVGLQGAIVVIGNMQYDVQGIIVSGNRPIVEELRSKLAPDAELYADVNCYRMGIPLRSQ